MWYTNDLKIILVIPFHTTHKVLYACQNVVVAENQAKHEQNGSSIEIECCPKERKFTINPSLIDAFHDVGLQVHNFKFYNVEFIHAINGQ